MAATLLTIDCGNSTFDLRAVGTDGAELRRQRQVELDLRGFLAGDRPERAVCCSVRGDRFRALTAGAAELGIELDRAGDSLPCPLELRYPVPSELGVDRWVAAVGARQHYGDTLFVDCGTAVTWNLVTAAGVFLGGAIGLGLRSQVAALRARAPELPALDESRPEQVPAVRTLDALRLGVGRGFVHAVEGLAAELAATASSRDFARVVTGGDAELALSFGLGGGGLGEFVHDPVLVHRGLEVLARDRS